MAQYDINLREYWRIIRKRKVIVILTTILLTLFSVALAIIRAPSPLYQATCSIKFEKAISPLGLYAKTISWGAGSEIETQMSVIKSYPVFKKVAFSMGLLGKIKDSESAVGQIITNLQSQIEISQEGYSNILNITATDTSPEFAADLANEVALAYKKAHTYEINQRTAEAIKFIKGQLEVVGKRLRKSEERLRRFREDKDIIALSSQSSNLLSRVGSLETKLAETIDVKKEFEDVMERIKEASSHPLGSKSSFSSEKASALYQSLNSRLVNLMLERDTLLVQYTSSHPQVIKINKQILEITQKMITELGSQLKVQTKKEEELRKEVDNSKGEIQSLPTKGLQLSRLERDVKRTSEIYSLLESKYQEALIQNAEKPEEVTIVRPALEPVSPINPPKIFSSGLLGAMIGLVFGLVFAFIVETFDTSLGAIDDVEQTLGLQVLGLIPYIEPKDAQVSLKDKSKGGIADDTLARSACLIPHFGSQSVLAESFRSLRTNIQFNALEKNIKSIVLTSAIPQEGKTVVSANLAITMAQGGLKTLLLGADLRKPTIHRIFGLDASPGVTDLILGSSVFSETVKTVTDIMMGKMSMDEIMLTPGIDNLHIITCGTIPSNPGELMQSERFKDFIDEIHDQYDVILIDTPPLISAADASILTMKADGALLVYRAGAVARGILKRVKAQLEQVKANIIGVVLNGVKAEISPDFEELKKHKYYHYYGEEGKKKKKEKGTHKFLRFFLILLALFFLTVGLLWQNGIIDLDKYLFKNRQVVEENKIPSSPTKGISPIKVEIPKPGSLKISTSINYPYSLHTGSLKSLREVNKDTSFLKGRGLSPYWDRVDLGSKGKWFRVFVGYFKTLEEAKEFKESLSIPGSRVLKTRYTNEIGYFASKEEMKEKIISLKKAGYSPYIIEYPEKGYRLLIGAFLTKKGADQLARALKKAGIYSTVVLR